MSAPKEEDKPVRKHPCLVQYGKCDYGRKCKFATFPGDTCLNFLRGTCTRKQGCWYRHDVAPGGCVKRKEQIVQGVGEVRYVGAGSKLAIAQPVDKQGPDPQPRPFVEEIKHERKPLKLGFDLSAENREDTVFWTTNKDAESAPREQDQCQGQGQEYQHPEQYYDEQYDGEQYPYPEYPEYSEYPEYPEYTPHQNGFDGFMADYGQPNSEPSQRVPTESLDEFPKLGSTSTGGAKKKAPKPREGLVVTTTMPEQQSKPQKGALNGNATPWQPSPWAKAVKKVPQSSASQSPTLMPVKGNKVENPTPLLHPCIVQLGSCRYGNSCDYARLPADTCLMYLQGACKFGTACRNRHSRT